MLGKHSKNPNWSPRFCPCPPTVYITLLLKVLPWVPSPRVTPASLCAHCPAVCPARSAPAALLFLEARRPPQGLHSARFLCLEALPDLPFAQTLNPLLCGTSPDHLFKFLPTSNPPSLYLLDFPRSTSYPLTCCMFCSFVVYFPSLVGGTLIVSVLPLAGS